MHEFIEMKDKKVLIADIKGRIDMEEGMNILEELKARVSKLNTKEYSFILNGKTVVPASLIVIPLIQKFIKYCYSIDFKKLYFVGNDVQNNYAKSLIKSNNNLNKDITLSGSVEEILAKLK